ncbi:RNA-binding protein [Anoxynatronum sibiricum]
MGIEAALSRISQSETRQRWEMLIDQARQVTDRHIPKTSFFLTPGEWLLAESLLVHIGGLKWLLDGGFDNAERRRLVMVPDYLEPSDFRPLVLFLEISRSHKSFSLTHRDYLGALLSLGVQRDVVGDIVILEETAWVALVPEMADYVMWNLENVGRVKVKNRLVESIPVKPPSTDMHLVEGTVASLRLDAVLSLAMKTSRNKAQVLVAGQKVSVNWQAATKQNIELHEGDVLSVKGYGRIQLLRIGSLSRSQRWHVQIGIMK